VTEQRRGARGRPPQVPPTPREPIGRDRVGQQRGPKRPSERSGAPQRPDMPEDTEIDLPARVRKEIDRLVNERTRARDVKICLTLGTAASEADDHTTARRYLAWAKHLAPRSTSVRETLGIALYRADDLKGALSELQTYRRMSGSNDQNHLLADCLRADGRDLDRAISIGMELVEDENGDLERRVEAAIVVAAIHLSGGRPARAGSVIGPFLSGPGARNVPPDSLVRLLWVAADVAEAEGTPQRAIDALRRLLSIDAEYEDAEERLTGLLEGSGG
jgi:tetratricopeptide (TPR) repeat protein